MWKMRMILALLPRQGQDPVIKSQFWLARQAYFEMIYR